MQEVEPAQSANAGAARASILEETGFFPPTGPGKKAPEEQRKGARKEKDSPSDEPASPDR